MRFRVRNGGNRSAARVVLAACSLKLLTCVLKRPSVAG